MKIQKKGANLMTMPSTNNPINAFRVNKNTLREGIPVEKGYVLSEDFLIKNEELMKQYCRYFMRYPDLFLELTQTKDCPIKFYYY